MELVPEYLVIVLHEATLKQNKRLLDLYYFHVLLSYDVVLFYLNSIIPFAEFTY